jgi:hypothetical protein
MHRVSAIAVFLAAAAFLPSLEARMRSIQRPGVATRISVGSRFRAVQLPPVSSRVMSPRPIGRRASLVRSVAFRHNVRFQNFLGNACFTGRAFDSFFCRQFFRNRILFAQPVFLPYPVSTAPYSQAAEQNSSPVAYQEDDLSGQVERLTHEVERLREEQPSREQPRSAALQSKPRFEDKTATTNGGLSRRSPE